MNNNNLETLKNLPENQPVIVFDGKAYPIGYSPRSCTATAADIRKGRTAVTADGITSGTLAVSSDGAVFAKVTDFNEQTQKVSAVSVRLENGIWKSGSSVALNSYDENLTVDGIYLVNGTHAVGSAICCDFEKWMPTAGLLSYFPLKGGNSQASDYIGKTLLTSRGSGVFPTADNWCGNGNAGSLCGALPYSCPQTFSLCLKFQVDDFPEDYGDILPLFQVDYGFAVYVGRDDRIRTYINTSQMETFDFERGTEYQMFLICDGNSVRTYCTQNKEVWHNNIRGCSDLPQSDAMMIYILGYSNAASIIGKVSDILLYNRALNEEEITIIAAHQTQKG